jgi:hypothetical protein
MKPLRSFSKEALCRFIEQHILLIDMKRLESIEYGYQIELVNNKIAALIEEARALSLPKDFQAWMEIHDCIDKLSSKVDKLIEKRYPPKTVTR